VNSFGQALRLNFHAVCRQHSLHAAIWLLLPAVRDKHRYNSCLFQSRDKSFSVSVLGNFCFQFNECFSVAYISWRSFTLCSDISETHCKDSRTQFWLLPSILNKNSLAPLINTVKEHPRQPRGLLSRGTSSIERKILQWAEVYGNWYCSHPLVPRLFYTVVLYWR
jgi:hypothetical protein